MVMKWIWWFGLSIVAAEDWKCRQINLKITGLWLVPGLLSLAADQGGLRDHMLACCIGVAMLALSKMTGGAIGAGDGLFFLLTACYLSFRETALFFLLSLGVSFLWSSCLLLRGWFSGRGSLKESVPFLTCAWLPGLWIVLR